MEVDRPTIPPQEQSAGRFASLYRRARAWVEADMPLPWDRLAMEREQLQPLQQRVHELLSNGRSDPETHIALKGARRMLHLRHADILSKHALHLDEHRPVMSGMRKAIAQRKEQWHRRLANWYSSTESH